MTHYRAIPEGKVQPQEYGPAEDVHMVLDHLVGAFLLRYVKGVKG